MRITKRQENMARHGFILMAVLILLGAIIGFLVGQLV